MVSQRGSSEKTVRLTVRLPVTVKGQAEFWAAQDSDAVGGHLALNDFVALAVSNEVARRAGKLIDVDNLLAKRIEQLADAQAAMSVELETIGTAVTSSYSSLIGLARGDGGVLVDAEDQVEPVGPASARRNGKE